MLNNKLIVVKPATGMEKPLLFLNSYIAINEPAKHNTIHTGINKTSAICGGNKA